MDRIQKESMNRKEIYLSFDDLVSIDMTPQNATEVLFLYEDLARGEDGHMLDTSSHADIPMMRQLAMAVDSMQTQMEFLMDQVDSKKLKKHPKSSRIHAESST